ncbi:MAG TPA: SPFH domain-containing protein, partial [Rhodanobacteraceae bacterium]
MPNSDSGLLKPLLRHGAWIIVLVIVIVILLFDSFVTVGPGKRGVLMTFGSVHQGVLAPGLHFKLPFMQTVREMDVQIQKSSERQMAASKDLQDVTTTVAVNWSIDP